MFLFIREKFLLCLCNFMVIKMQIKERKQHHQNSAFIIKMNAEGTVALILCIFALMGIIATYYFVRGMKVNYEDETGEIETATVTVTPSAPVINVTEDTVDQARSVNDALQIEENGENSKEEFDLPPAYEDLFVKNEV